ncbi:unnamed protein product [Ectocarpus sp. 4 AP-2014]
MPAFNANNNKRRGTGKKRRNNRSRPTETAPHILAALEAQRARTAQQVPAPPSAAAAAAAAAATTTPGSGSPPQPPPPLPQALPGHMFDPARNRYFRCVKDCQGTPGTVVADSKSKQNLRIKIGEGKSKSSGPPTPPARTGSSKASGGESRSNFVASQGGNGRTYIAVAASAGCPADAAPRTGHLDSRSVGRRGLHPYAMSSRRGLWGWDDRTRRSCGLPAGSERLRRIGLESAVSSSRFRVRDHVPWAHTSVIHGAGYSAVDWDAGRGVLIAGRKNGGLAVMMTGAPMNVGDGGGGDAPLRGFAPRWGGAQKEEERVLLTAASTRWRSQVSDIKFRGHGAEWACAIASLGGGGQPGGVTARFWTGRGDLDNVFSEARLVDQQLHRGSAWCTEWDPLTPARLAIGPSSCSPVVFFDVDQQRVIPIAKLSGDVFSMSFLPAAAPGAGSALICGLRDGTVVLIDPRQPYRHGTAAAAGTLLAPRADPSSVDHTHILRDGTRCLVKDRSGCLQATDLRFFGHRAGALEVLVPPGGQGKRAPWPAKFALDATETVVATPVAAEAAAAARADGDAGAATVVGGGERFPPQPHGWQRFTSSSIGGLPDGIGGGIYDVRNDHGGGYGAEPVPAEGDSVRLLNVSSGEVLNDIQTPWPWVSLARGAGATVDGREGGGGGGGCCRREEVRFWGTALAPGRGAAVFEARMTTSEDGYGREQTSGTNQLNM